MTTRTSRAHRQRGEKRLRYVRHATGPLQEADAFALVISMR
jgi:hypothetical protein